MVMTHKSMQEKAKKGFTVKDDDPSRKHMSYADALAKNEKLRENDLKVERFKESLKSDVVDVSGKVPEPQEYNPATSSPVNDDSTSFKIRQLEEKIANERGPGSNHRKAKIQAEIDKLKS